MFRRIQTISLFVLVIFGVGLAGARFFNFKNGTSGFGFAKFFQPEETFRSVVYAIEEGDTWGVITEKLQMNSEMGSALLIASEADGAHPLTDIRAGNPIELRYDKGTGEFIELRYDISDEDMLVVARKVIEENLVEFIGQKRKIEYVVVPVVEGGVIESSLFETALAEGVPEAVILDMAWIFSWDIDFNTAIRTGDSFRVVYEKRTRNGEPVKPGRVLAAQFLNDGVEFFSFYYVDPEGDAEYRNADGDELKRQFLRAPLDYRRISSGFSTNRYVEVLKYFSSHRAIDYAASSGTPVSATADGTITFLGWNGDHGRHIRIKHGNGYETGYSHLSAYAKGMKVGARVKQNDVIGFVGSSGLSTGPHLHYEMRLNGGLVNPLSLDLPPGKPLKEEYLSDFETRKAQLLGLLWE
jgi:murein DD-endopeptidase MepM/ murein hydrolase activator NlpD